METGVPTEKSGCCSKRCCGWFFLLLFLVFLGIGGWLIYRDRKSGDDGTPAFNGLPAPSSVTASSNLPRRALVSWSAVAGADNYTIEIDNGNLKPVTTSGSVTSFNFTGLSNNVAYRFRVYGRDYRGPGLASSYSAPVTPRAVAPSAPTLLTAYGGSGAAFASWTAPTDDGGEDIDRYTVTASGSNTVSKNTTFTSTSISGITGASTTITVRALNKAGLYSAASNSIVISVPSTVPSLVQNPVAAQQGATSISVTFSAPLSDGGSAIRNYTVNCGGNLQGTLNAGSPPLPAVVISNVPVFVQTVCTVKATNDVGDSVPAEANPVTLPASAPNAVANVVATPLSASANVTFALPSGLAQTGGLPIKNVTLTSSTGGLVTSPIVLTGGPSTTFFFVTGLTPLVTYNFTVAVATEFGFSPAVVSSNIAILPSPPLAPTGVIAIGGRERATVSWRNPSNNGGAPIVAYYIKAYPADPSGTSVTRNSTTSPIDITGLTGGVSYTFTITAYNTFAFSPESAPSNPITPTKNENDIRGGDDSLSIGLIVAIILAFLLLVALYALYHYRKLCFAKLKKKDAERNFRRTNSSEVLMPPHSNSYNNLMPSQSSDVATPDQPAPYYPSSSSQDYPVADPAPAPALPPLPPVPEQQNAV